NGRNRKCPLHLVPLSEYQPILGIWRSGGYCLQGCGRLGRLNDAGNRKHHLGKFHAYSPPTVSPSMRRLGDATELRNSRSLATSEMFMNMSFRLPATVISSTGYVSSPPD